MREQGLRVESALGKLQIKVLAYERPEEIGAVDYVVFAVELADVEGAAERLRPLLHERTLVLCFQNGVEAPETVARVIGAQHVDRQVTGSAASFAAGLNRLHRMPGCDGLDACGQRFDL